MKTIVSYLLVITCLVSRVAAQIPVTVITYVTRLPLTIESRIYVDTLINDELMHVVSEKIRIALAPRSTLTDTERYLVVSNANHRNETANMVYRAYLNRDGKNNWQKLPKQPSVPLYFPFDCLLADTSLQPGDQLVLEFRFASSPTIIQRCTFRREPMTPEIYQYREKNSSDRVNDSILANALKQTGIMQKGFVKPVTNSINLKAGNRLEMILKNRSLNRDSSVQYRLCNTAKATDTSWKRSGHLLTLSDLPANDSFVLEVKYEGMPSIKQYKIAVAPFWYQRSWASVLFGMAAVLLFIISPYLIRQRSLRNEKEKRKRDEDQLKNAQSQLNPHFIFNALNSIYGLVQEGENEKATIYLAHFSDMMRNTLLNGDIVFTTLSEDIAVLEKYISIEQLRFDFRYMIVVDPLLDKEAIEFPPMILQPAVENAVKHGVAAMGSMGLILINYKRNGNDLVVTIKDNGNKKHPAKQNGTGRGIAFTKERIEALHKLYKYEIDYQTVYSADHTQVFFHFKNWL